MIKSDSELQIDPPVREINKACYRDDRKGGRKLLYNSKAFGLVISTLRTEKDMTQEQLSGLAGIARTHLAALESGEKVPRVDTLWRIAEALSVRPSRLIQMVEKMIERDSNTNDKEPVSPCRPI